MTKNSKQIDLLAMNVTWFPKDFEVYDNQVGIMEATILTTGIPRFTLLMWGHKEKNREAKTM